jgi:bifunctional UDP-N-acetylglucosamine pyrophosphorylase/glucosamine-1-phosphate N-acetyltransferase
MSHYDTIAVILAAGKGTRLKSDRAKVLHEAGGLPLVEHVLRACQPLDLMEIVVVVGHQAGEAREVVERLGATTVLQEPQRGTGHALQIARPALDPARFVLVLPGDAPLARPETLRQLLEAHLENYAAATLLTAELEDPKGYGRIVRDEDGTVRAIIEEKSCTPEQKKIREINAGFYCFTAEKLWPCLEHLQPANAHKELYLTDTIELLAKKGHRTMAIRAADAQEVLGCNTRAELAEVDRVFRRRKIAALMEDGVSTLLPETILADADVTAGRDTTIEPNVMLLGCTTIGEGCRIGTGSVLRDAVLGNDVEIKPYSMVISSRLANGSAAGPFAHLREGAEIGEKARIGNFVEVKKCRIGAGTKAMHLTYLGDATIGEAANIGAGTITCNYDGMRKNPTSIGARAFVGSGTELVAPVSVGDGAYIAAGSTITENVPSGALGLARARQVNKAGWVAERRAKSPASMAGESAAAEGAAKRSMPPAATETENSKPARAKAALKPGVKSRPGARGKASRAAPPK